MRLKLIQNSKLLNAAILFFGNCPQDFFLQSEAKCVHFKGTKVTGPMIDMNTIGGNLINQVKEIERFIFNNIKMAAWIESGKYPDRINSIFVTAQETLVTIENYEIRERHEKGGN